MSVKGKSPSKRYAPLHFGGESATGQTRDGRFDKVVKFHCTFSISMMMTAQQARRIPWAQNFSAGSITVGRPFRRQERDQRAAALSRPLRRPRRLHPHPRVIHVGDIIIEDNDIFGDGVNIAVRLEGIAERKSSRQIFRSNGSPTAFHGPTWAVILVGFDLWTVVHQSCCTHF